MLRPRADTAGDPRVVRPGARSSADPAAAVPGRVGRRGARGLERSVRGCLRAHKGRGDALDRLASEPPALLAWPDCPPLTVYEPIAAGSRALQSNVVLQQVRDAPPVFFPGAKWSSVYETEWPAIRAGLTTLYEHVRVEHPKYWDMLVRIEQARKDRESSSSAAPRARRRMRSRQPLWRTGCSVRKSLGRAARGHALVWHLLARAPSGGAKQPG